MVEISTPDEFMDADMLAAYRKWEAKCLRWGPGNGLTWRDAQSFKAGYNAARKDNNS